MLHSVFPGTILVVEGPTDHRLYGKFTDRDQVRTVIANSKQNVKNVVREVGGRRGLKEVVGIIDSDLDILLGAECRPPLFRTDTRDSESLMTCSDSFREVLWEYADQDLLSRFEERYGDVVGRIENGAYPLGLLMYASHEEGFNLCFKDLVFEDFIDRRDLSCSVSALCRSVVANTMRCPVSPRTLQGILEEYLAEEHDPRSVCRGHDLVSVLNVGLKYIFGSDNGRHLKDSVIGSALRLSYDLQQFSATKLYEESRSYAQLKGLKLWNE